MLVHIGDLKGVDSPVTPSFHFDNDVFRGSDLHVGVTPPSIQSAVHPSWEKAFATSFSELLVSSSVCAGRTELVSEVGSWSVVFVVFVVDGWTRSPASVRSAMAVSTDSSRRVGRGACRRLG